MCCYKYFQIQSIEIMQTMISDKENKLEINNRKLNFKLYIQKSIAFLHIATSALKI